MRVGVLAPISWRVPPRLYGPLERVVSVGDYLDVYRAALAKDVVPR